MISLNKIMVVVDESMIRKNICEMLEEEGYVVAAEARNGEEAVEKAYLQKLDLILMDRKMPKVSGVKASKIISSFSDAVIVLLTDQDQKSIIKDIKEAGATAYLVKPVIKENLIPTIEIALGQKARLSELRSSIRELQLEMETRKELEKAKGKIMERLGFKEEEAMRWLQKESMQRRMPLAKVAEGILIGKHYRG
ncbi:ANTAR domain-containing response regulator [Niallia sp. 03133]|uniref:ANTAR domain-containing response regulator n=1 Tax=Niallia sp. 03133 TaxID=3458060 RepID=UPI0040443EC7